MQLKSCTVAENFNGGGGREKSRIKFTTGKWVVCSGDLQDDSFAVND